MTDAECVALLQWALPRLGLRWAGFRRVRRQVCKRISRRMAELGLPDASAYRARLTADAAEWAFLDSCCRISISRFYRDRGVFEQLATTLLSELARLALAQGRRSVRAWSAGCASGEEPYSLRIVWDLCVASLVPDAELEIVATDASPELLARAERAVYPASAVRDLPARWRATAFDRLDDSYRLREAFRAGVDFRREDIRETLPPGPFDLILCRNLVFTYFGPALQREVLSRLLERLGPDGALLVGAHETLPEPAPLARSPQTVGLYRRAPRPPKGRGPSGLR